MNITPNDITELGPNDIFVFGSNERGIHGAGAAKLALKWGARRGIGYGMSGQTFAIPTKDEAIQTLPLDRIEHYIMSFLQVAHNRPSFRYLVTQIGCGLAGYTPNEIAPLFFKYEVPDNVTLPASFWKHATL